MNCIIQCLSNTRPLLEFCLDTEQHETDANASVRNGHLIKGKLCTSSIAVFHVSPGVSSKKRPRTGSTYISGTMRDSVEIPTTRVSCTPLQKDGYMLICWDRSLVVTKYRLQLKILGRSYISSPLVIPMSSIVGVKMIPPPLR